MLIKMSVPGLQQETRTNHPASQQAQIISATAAQVIASSSEQPPTTATAATEVYVCLHIAIHTLNNI